MNMYSTVKRTFDFDMGKRGQNFQVLRSEKVIGSLKGIKNREGSYIVFYPGNIVEGGDILECNVSSQKFNIIELDYVVVEDRIAKVKAFYTKESQRDKFNGRQNSTMSDEQNQIQEKLLSTMSHLGEFSADTLAKELKISKEKSEAHIVEFDKLGLIKQSDLSGKNFTLSPSAQSILRNKIFPTQGASSTVINIHGNVESSNLNVNSILENSQQTIEASSIAGKSQQEELSLLVQELTQALESVPIERSEEAEAIAVTANSLIEAAAGDKPNQALLKISADGLKQAAKNIIDIAPSILAIATKIVSIAIQS